MKFIFLFALALPCLLGCGRRPADPRPCVGVNPNACDLPVREASAWTERRPLSSANDRVVTIRYDFAPGEPARWRRSLTDAHGTDVAVMFAEGRVSAITDDRLILITERSSCDDVGRPEPAVLQPYYRRAGTALTLSDAPIPPPERDSSLKLDGLGEAIAMPFEIFTSLTWLGSPRMYLSVRPNRYVANVAAREAATPRYGCFAAIGMGFDESTLRPGW